MGAARALHHGGHSGGIAWGEGRQTILRTPKQRLGQQTNAKGGHECSGNRIEPAAEVPRGGRLRRDAHKLHKRLMIGQVNQPDGETTRK